MDRDVFLFLVMVLCGGGISLLLDFFRACRAAVKSNNAIVAVSDILFCALSLFIVFACVWNFGSGKFRFYEIVGLVLGGIFYFLLLSKWIFAVFLWIIKNILKIVGDILKILLTPPLFLYKILIVPIKNSIKAKVRKDNGTYDE